MDFRTEDLSDAATASTSASQVQETPIIIVNDFDPNRNHFPDHHPLTREDDVHRRLGGSEQPERNDPWSGVIAVVTFWSFVSMTLMFGLYGSEIFELGSNASILIKPNPLFIQSLMVERLNVAFDVPMLYGFDVSPTLDVVSSWSEHHKAILPGGTHKEWMFYLNKGSQIDIKYNMTSLIPSSLVIVIAEGIEGLSRWLEDPSYPNTTLLWERIRGTGVIGQGISKSANYYIAVGNLNSDIEEVELHFGIKALLYNTTNAYYKCSVARGPCHMRIPFTGGNSALLTSFGLKLCLDAHPLFTVMCNYYKYYPQELDSEKLDNLEGGLRKGVKNDNCTVKISYGPRWITYLGGIGGAMVLMSLAVYYFNHFRSISQGERSIQGNGGSTSEPLLSRKDDDNLSLGSSYDSISEDDEDHSSVDLQNGKPASDHENNNNQRLCAICFDAPRDSFFIPCGHCVSCYTCGTKIAEAAGTCPICRRHMKKVRKIYTV